MRGTMEKETISTSQGFSILSLFIMGSTLIMGTAPEAKRDSWIAVIIATIAAIPLLLSYAAISRAFPEKDMFDILEILFGKIFGKIISALYVWYFFHLGSLVMRNFGEFMNTLAMPETPMFVPMICIGILCIWVSRAGIEVLGRCTKILLLTCGIVVIIIQCLAIPYLDIHNIKPILGQGLKPVINGAFSSLSFPFAESIAFLGVASCLGKNSSSRKIYIRSLLFSAFFITIIALRNTMVLSSNIIEIIYFPAYSAVGRINIGDSIQRMEGTVAIIFATGVFVKVSICLLASSKGVSKILGLKSYRSVVIQIGLLMSYLAYFIYDSTMDMEYWAFSIYRYYAFPFQIIFPIIIFIIIEVKRKKHKLSTN